MTALDAPPFGPAQGTTSITRPRDAWDWRAVRGLLADYVAHLECTFDVGPLVAVDPAFRAELRDPSAVFGRAGATALLARRDRLPVGVVGLRPLADAVELTRCYVRPLARGHGIGRALVAAALAEAAGMGHRRVVLDTVPRRMVAAHRTYRRLGFVATEEPHALPVGGAVRMALDLAG